MHTNGRHMIGTALVALLAFGLGACDDASSPDEATLSLLLTDASTDLKEAWVEIDEIYLQGTRVNGERVDLLTEPTGPINLLTLAGENTVALIEDAVVPAGTYAQLRFVVNDGYIVTGDDQVFATRNAELPAGVTADGMLECPSCSETGFKVNLPDGAVTLDDEGQILVVDFDVEQSYGREAGLAGLWVMHPVMNATDFQVSGTIAGTVSLDESISLPTSCGGETPSLADFVPMATSGDQTKTGEVADDGSYRISFVQPGEWSLSFEPSVEIGDGTLGFQADHPALVNVESGSTSEADYTVTAANCN